MFSNYASIPKLIEPIYLRVSCAKSAAQVQMQGKT